MTTPTAFATARRYFAPWRVAEILRAAETGMLASVRASLTAGQFGAGGGPIWLNTEHKGVSASFDLDGPKVLHPWSVLFAVVTDQAKARPRAAARLREACTEHTAATRAYLAACSPQRIGEVTPAQQAASDAQIVASRAVRSAVEEFWQDGAEADVPGQLDLFAASGSL
jgi:hypothetical protein